MKLKFENGEDIVRCNCNFQKISRQFGFQRGISMGQIDIEQEQDLMRHPPTVIHAEWSTSTSVEARGIA